MKTSFSLLCVVSLLLTTPLAAEDLDPAADKKIFVAVKADDLDLARTDISHLAVGDAETVHTESGRTVDLLRTEEGVEVYVDGERVAMGPHGDAEPGEVHKRIQIICDDEAAEGDCEELAMLDHGDIDLEAMAAAGQHVIVIRDGEGEGGDEVTISEDVEHHAEGEVHKIIVIEKSGEEI
jgi:hypothetical protein